MKILLFDIETNLSIMATFSLFPERIPIDNVLEDFNIICASWKWLGEDKVHSASVADKKREFNKNPRNDRHVVEQLAAAIEEADMVVGHNGKKFDMKKLRSRMFSLGMKPLADVLIYDTLTVSRRLFGHTSHRLDYIARLLGVDGKTKTSSGLWLKALQGDATAIKEMALYCDQDVRVLEDVYNAIRPWDTSHPHVKLFKRDADTVCCPNCGSHNLTKKGVRMSRIGLRQRYICDDCGRSSTDKATMITTERR